MDKGKKEGEDIERWRMFKRGRKKKLCLGMGERMRTFEREEKESDNV